MECLLCDQPNDSSKKQSQQIKKFCDGNSHRGVADSGMILGKVVTDRTLDFLELFGRFLGNLLLAEKVLRKAEQPSLLTLSNYLQKLPFT